MGQSSSNLFLGINLYVDPSVALVRQGKVLAFSEEERHLRNKHAVGIYPARALRYCLKAAGASIEDVAAVGINWNLPAYANGEMRAFYQNLRQQQPVDAATLAWQERTLRTFDSAAYQESHHVEWRRLFGPRSFPGIRSIAHHFTHAFQAFMQSPFDEAVCLTLDGSGDQHCTVVWHCRGSEITPIREIVMPHSLGWFYAAFTEYLGFHAYDGEYKVMGLAAYGRPQPALQAAVGKVLRASADGTSYEVESRYIHNGPHSYSGRFTDHLSELLGRAPRSQDEELGEWHQDLAFAVQEALEVAVMRLARWAMDATGVRRLCVSGGIAHNIKMNSKLFLMDGVEDVFAHPLCGDSGAAAGAALAACFQIEGHRPERLKTLALGPEEELGDIESALRLAHLQYERPDDICDAVADELSRGRIVGWFQGRMEAGPRALGQRSILADPRRVENRDKVNAIIKFREFWRPFCPSMTSEAAERYFDKYTEAPFMTLAFPANPILTQEAPAVVHVDGTVRVQVVRREVNPRFHRLIEAFGRRTGVHVVLNTSFNVKGEPIVCTVADALRTFWATGLEILAAGDFLIRKPGLS
jgi:carbamoyltransferase